EYHHGKHHAAYVNNLNKLIEGTDFQGLNLEDTVKKAFTDKNIGVFNNAAQHFNHSFFWNCLSPSGGGKPTGKLAEMIDRDFGSYDKFKETFSAKAATLFGSGWAWLVTDSSGKLDILQMSNAGTPITEGKKPLLTIDVWEHAYYIDHRNARPSFISGFWDVVNWNEVNNRF
ncbi:MAG: superoxide dismutase, partial [Bacteroidales bacterium]|nr:superoxide dismutase [Bacteroidales bacterium]